MIIRNARLVDLDARPGPRGGHQEAFTLDVFIENGNIAAIGENLRADGDEMIDADGRWLIPGLWDQHVHLGQWAVAGARLDLSETSSADDVIGVLQSAVRGWPRDRAIVGFGFRSATWADSATTAAIDAIVGDRPAILISGDAHSAWLSSRAFADCALSPHDGLIDEREWFEIVPTLTDVFRLHPSLADYQRAIAAAHERGVVGIVDLEFENGLETWPTRVAAGIDTIRVRSGVYPDDLDAVLRAGIRTGDRIAGYVDMGPLKIISDGSLGTRTAYCCEPYVDGPADERSVGTQNYSLAEMSRLLARAHRAGLDVAVHAIGDAALSDALAAFEATGARGSIEHAQLVRLADIPRIARLGLRASVQPAHLIDDRDIAGECWPDRLDRCYAFESMQRGGVELVLGSDAPVAALDPWLAMDAAVRRTGDDRAPWSPDERLTRRDALAASVDRNRIAVGSPADVVLVEVDPLAEDTDLRTVPVAATLVDGRAVHRRDL